MKSDKKEQDNYALKREIELYKDKINKLLEKPEMGKKAAHLVSLMLEKKKRPPKANP